jgi:hypothetical protein
MILRMRAYSATSTVQAFRRKKRIEWAQGTKGDGENVAEIVIKTREIHFDVYKDVSIAFERKLLGRRRGMNKKGKGRVEEIKGRKGQRRGTKRKKRAEKRN